MHRPESSQQWVGRAITIVHTDHTGWENHRTSRVEIQLHLKNKAKGSFIAANHPDAFTKSGVTKNKGQNTAERWRCDQGYLHIRAQQTCMDYGRRRCFELIFRPSATVSRIGLMESCTCQHGGLPPPLAGYPSHVMDGWGARPLR